MGGSPDVQGEQVIVAAGLPRLYTVPGKHFPQEDQAPAIAERIAELALRQPQRPIRSGPGR
jgi:hypothetical protein